MAGANGKRRLRNLSLALLLVAIAVVAWPKWVAMLDSAATRDIEGGPVLARDASGDAILATVVVHEASRGIRKSAARGPQRIVELQLNRMTDASDIGRVFVHRTSRSGNLNVHLLGADADRVWVFAEGIRAVSVTRLVTEIDPPALEARIPQLRGQLPDDRKFYELDPATGLRLTARDGSRYVINTQTWSITPQPEPTPALPAQDLQRSMREWSARMDESTATSFAQLPGEYGLDSWRHGNQWLGMLSDAEQRNYSRAWERPQRHSAVNPERRKLWTASASTNAQGTSDLAEMRALGSKTYLRGGFLRDGKRLRPVQEKNSPDLFVEHYSAVDDSAQMLLTRITPAGDELWTATLPLHLPQTISATEQHVAFRGLPPGTTYYHRAQLVCVSLRDGTFHTFAFN